MLGYTLVSVREIRVCPHGTHPSSSQVHISRTSGLVITLRSCTPPSSPGATGENVVRETIPTTRLAIKFYKKPRSRVYLIRVSACSIEPGGSLRCEPGPALQKTEPRLTVARRMVPSGLLTRLLQRARIS